MKKIIFLFFLTLFVSSCGTAQQKYSIKNKKATKLFDAGMQQPRLGVDPKTGGPDYPGGINLIKKALEKEPNFWEAHATISEFYEIMRNYDLAAYHLQEALRISPNHSPTGASYFYLANLLKNQGKFAESNARLDQFLLYKAANPELIKAAVKMQNSNYFAIEAMQNPVPFDPKNVGPGINTANPEYFPTITVDGKTVLFTRRLKDSRIVGANGEGEQEDFYVSNLNDNNVWGNAISMPTNINTINNEGAPTLAPDGRSLIFVACPDASGQNYGDSRNGFGSCDLFYTKKIGSRWTNPQNLPGKVNTNHWETQPSLSADGKTMYFIRGIYNRTGTKSSDIYVTRLQDDNTWSSAEKLPSTINSDDAEESVLIHPDGKTLYFGSRGHIGVGGTDLFMSRMDEKGNWGPAINLGYPINTHYDENSLMVSADGEIGFFASNRSGGYGDLDIYSFPMPAHLKPTKTIYFEGIVYDVETKLPLPGKFKLIDLETGKEIIYSEADGLTGEFMVSLPVNRAYVLNVSYPGYAFFSKNFDLIEKKGQESFKMDVPMIAISSDLPIVLENIFFDLNKAILRPESYIELQKLTEFLQQNVRLKIEIGGHTDSRGNANDNLKLSTERAKAVYDYLIAKNIDAARLTYKGYGSKSPIIADSEILKYSDAQVIEAAHQKNRRTEYKIIK